MAEIIIKGFKNSFESMKKNLHDILIIVGLILFIGTMFKFVSQFVGYLSLSVVLIILGIIIAKLKS